MKYLYVAIQAAEYRHNIIGVFTTVETAVEAGKAAVTKETDHYHEVLVLRVEQDSAVDDGELICTIFWQGGCKVETWVR